MSNRGNFECARNEGLLNHPRVTQVAESSEFIAGAFRAWRQAGAGALVLRNYLELPANPGNDIDILICLGDIGRAEKILRAAAQECGWRLHNRAEYATLALYFHSASGAQAHFDLFSGFTWRGVSYVDQKVVLEQRRLGDLFDVPSSLHENAINLLSGLFYSGKVKEKYRSAILASANEEQEALTDFISSSVGPAMAARIVTNVKTENWPAVESLAASMRRGLLWRQLSRAPFQTLLGIAGDVARFTRRFLNPPGLAMALCGPDGCGKSTVAPLLTAALDRSFPQDKGARIHWKPAVFSRQRREARGPSTDPHSKPARNTLVSLIFFAAHWIEFFLGWHLMIRPVMFRGGLVLIDRWYYDFFVDQRRYRLKVPMSVVRLGYILLPKPHLVCLLNASTSILRERKQEVSPEETERQRAAYLKTLSGLSNAQVISAARPPGEVANAISQAALLASSQRLEV